ncbi:MAG: RNA 2',3'-cyclic phosphodiesterase [Lachnospiraceae bacterium]|nr:RNA 2',3'-cyclic phosphodiesterase [Lachnospiraceae bacterium]
MRLFIALQFEENILDTLTDFQNNLKSSGVRGNYTKRENLHLTLAFIGDYGNPDEVLDAMAQVEFEPMEISLNGVGSFGDLFWVGLTENPQLVAYVKRLRRELADQGIPFDKKRFSPHITLIRKYFCKGGKIQVSDPPKGNMTATRVSLMQSEFGKNGMIYTEIGCVESM